MFLALYMGIGHFSEKKKKRKDKKKKGGGD